jgi:hypothetical protein
MTATAAVTVLALLAGAAPADTRCHRVRAALERSADQGPRITPAISARPIVAASPRQSPAQPTARVQKNGSDSIWNGLLIGAGIGAGGGYVWARSQCGSNDSECSAITTPVGLLAGAGIGAAIGAVLDAFSH